MPILILILACAAVALLIRQNKGPITISPSPSAAINYIAMGDSYTIGEGIKESERWPNLLTSNLQKLQIPIHLSANIARTGWTTQDLIDNGLPVYQTSHPDFATLLIGVNDWVQGVSAEDFKTNFNRLVDAMLTKLPNSKRLIIITIPDFSVVPSGKIYGKGRDISKGIAEFNTIIIEESVKRNIKVVDIFQLSQGMAKDYSLINWDGLHPSAKEYQLWEELIRPTALEAVK